MLLGFGHRQLCSRYIYECKYILLMGLHFFHESVFDFFMHCHSDRFMINKIVSYNPALYEKD